jgi:uncharacterized membrane protein (UPF0136 family)
MPLLVGLIVGTSTGLAAYALAGGSHWALMIPATIVAALIGSGAAELAARRWRS